MAEDIVIWDSGDVLKALSSGTEPEKVLNLVVADFDCENRTPDELYRMIKLIASAGCEAPKIQSAIQEIAWPDLIDDFFDNPYRWSKYINRDDYLDEWLEVFGWNIVSETEGLEILSRYDIPMDRWLSSLSMNNIIDSLRGYSFWEFLDDWRKHGGSVDAMAEKFINEIGYEQAGRDNDYFGVAIDLILSGSTIIDQKELATHIRPNVCRPWAAASLERDGKDMGVKITPELIEALMKAKS